MQNIPEIEPEIATWKSIVARFQKPSIGRAAWQLINTLGAYALTWCAIYFSRQISWWLVLPLAVVAAGLLVRLFIIFHDCSHGSFFRSRRANEITGYITGVFTFTPYDHWRWEHNIHHATSGHLDKRGTGDILTLTVQEYLEASRWKRFAYRLSRNPFILFVIAPLYLFLIRQRFPSAKADQKQRRSVYWTNLGIVAMAGVLIAVFGWKTYLLVQFLIIAISGAAGVWLFYVQHQFEGVYWERGENWDYTKAALEGSSFYKLPKILQWFSGNIGFHHIHHLSARIPNYHLEKCHRADPLFEKVKPITFLQSFKSLTFRLWDEQRRKLVGFGHLRKIKAAAASVSPSQTSHQSGRF